jgi:hypothetical protein
MDKRKGLCQPQAPAQSQAKRSGTPHKMEKPDSRKVADMLETKPGEIDQKLYPPTPVYKKPTLPTV